MKNTVEVQSALWYKCPFIQHPINKYASDGYRELPWNAAGARQISSEPALQRAAPRVHGSKFKFSSVKAL